MKKLFTLANLFLVILFFFAFLLLLSSSSKDSLTTDEHIHLFSGYTYLTKDSFRLDPEHPPLIKELAAFPLLLMKSIHVYYDSLWDKAANFYYDSWQEARILSERFLFEWGNNASLMIFWGRLIPIFLTIFLGVGVFIWAKKLYGQKAGIFAAFLILLLPNILAHGRLINTDIGLTLFFFLAIYFWVKFLKTPSWLNVFISGLFLGLTLASKFTGLLIVPILLVLLIVKIFASKKDWLKNLFGLLGISIIAFLFVWLTYGFSTKIFAAPPESISQNIQAWIKITPPVWFDNFFDRIRVFLFPADYWKGAYFVFRHSVAGHGSFLLGQLSNTGWWYYFPVAIYYKTPIPLFIFFILALIFTRRLSKKENKFDEIALIVAPAIYLGLSLFSKADLGVRHVLPIFPFIIVYCSRSINLVDFSGIKFIKANIAKMIPALIFLGLILWYLYSSLSAYPNYLAYFNELAGGSKNGSKILSDSNLDWGQDIFRIKKYLENKNITDYEIFYPWTGEISLRYYGLKTESLNENTTKPKIISATYLNYGFADWLKKYPFEQITPGVFVFYP